MNKAHKKRLALMVYSFARIGAALAIRLKMSEPKAIGALPQANAYAMIRRRAVAASIHAPIGNHTFRATVITAYLANGGALEHAQEMAAHESPAHHQALRPQGR